MDTGTDSATDSGDAGRWLTYSELAAIRRIDRHSAVKLAIRHRWRRQKDNHGQLRILVPHEWAAPKDRGMATSVPASVPTGTDTGTDIARISNAFDAALTALREQLERSEEGRDGERQRADRAELATTELRAEVDAARTETGALRGRLEFTQAALDQAQADARAARGEAETLRAAEIERLARGLLARIRAAVRGR